MSDHNDADGQPMQQCPAFGVHGFLSVVRRFLESAGGFTLHHHTGEHARDGVSVCADPTATLRFPLDEWDDEQVETWFERWTGQLRGSDLHLGGWLDPTTQWVWLDVVRVYPPSRRREALGVGRAYQQEAVFDLGEGNLLALRSPGSIAS